MFASLTQMSLDHQQRSGVEVDKAQMQITLSISRSQADTMFMFEPSQRVLKITACMLESMELGRIRVKPCSGVQPVAVLGVHTVSISAREDGFEIDRFALMKDLSGNTRVCEPVNLNGVNCRNGSIESADGFVDLRVRLFAEEVGADPEVEPPNPVEAVQGENIKLTANIENLDAFDTAHEIVLTLSPVPGDWNMIDMDNRCEVVGDEFECSLSELEPTAPNEFAAFEFTMQARLDGDFMKPGSLYNWLWSLLTKVASMLLTYCSASHRQTV